MARWISVFLALLLAGASFAATPLRIVSTAPSITELLFALGLGDRVAGVTTFCRYPPEATRKPKIGSYTDPNLEAIAALRPDLVVVQTNPVRLTERLRALKLNVEEIDQQNLAMLFNSFRIVGEAAGAPAAAARLTDSVRSQLDAIRARTAKLEKTRMTFVVGRAPKRLDGLVVVGRGAYLNELIDIAGGSNIFQDAVAAYPAISVEEMIARNPEVIVDMGDMSDTAGVTEAQKRGVVDLWSRLRTIDAVKKGRVHAVASDIYVVPGPRVVDAAREFLAMLHPEIR
jgi:iron complex transport system substrate-binding protein